MRQAVSRIWWPIRQKPESETLLVCAARLTPDELPARMWVRARPSSACTRREVPYKGDCSWFRSPIRHECQTALLIALAKWVRIKYILLVKSTPHFTNTKISILTKTLYSRNRQKDFPFSTLNNFYQSFYLLINQFFLCLQILDTSDLWLRNSFGLLYVAMVNFSSI